MIDEIFERITKIPLIMYFKQHDIKPQIYRGNINYLEITQDLCSRNDTMSDRRRFLETKFAR